MAPFYGDTALNFEALMKSKYNFKSIAWFTEAWICLGIARMMLVFRPFNKILPVLKSDATSYKIAGIETLQLIKLSIARAAVRSPWRTKCFEQALAARMMLKRRGLATVTYFGVLKNSNGSIEAHAWLECGAFVVTGWKKKDEYTVINIV